MTEAEFEVLNHTYFVRTFGAIVQKSELPEQTVLVAIKSLLEKEYLHQLYFDSELSELLRLEPPNFEDLSNYSYLCTKAGLLKHNLK